jgi:hypothetical protein
MVCNTANIGLLYGGGVQRTSAAFGSNVSNELAQ